MGFFDHSSGLRGEDTGPASDRELIEATRLGDSEAFAELWRRHSAAALAFARSYSRSVDPDDLVSESYIRVLGAIQRGNGPSGAFRPYLLASVRNLAIRWGRTSSKEVVTDEFDDVVGDGSPEDHAMQELARSTTARAFRSLPTRWQEALWYTEVERLPRADVAQILGIKPNAVSALSFRARDALRTAWIAAQLEREDLPEACRVITPMLAGYARHTLPRRDAKAVESHLGSCNSCLVLAEESSELASGLVSRLALVVLPLAVGTTGAAAYQAWLQLGAGGVVAVAAAETASASGAAAFDTMMAGSSLSSGAMSSVSAASSSAAASSDTTASSAAAGSAGPSAGIVASLVGTAAAVALAGGILVVAGGTIMQPASSIHVAQVPSKSDAQAEVAAPMYEAPAAALTPARSEVPAAPHNPVEPEPLITTPAVSAGELPPALQVPAVLEPAQWQVIDGSPLLLPTIEGVAAPLASVEVVTDGRVVARTVADAEGGFGFANLDVRVGSTSLVVRQIAADGRVSVSAPREVFVAVPEYQVRRQQQDGATLMIIKVAEPDGLWVEQAFDGVDPAIEGSPPSSGGSQLFGEHNAGDDEAGSVAGGSGCVTRSMPSDPGKVWLTCEINPAIQDHLTIRVTDSRLNPEHWGPLIGVPIPRDDVTNAP